MKALNDYLTGMLMVTDNGFGRLPLHAFPHVKMKILSIDDDPDDFVFLQEAVRIAQADCTCFHAADGQQAISWLQTQRPDLIFLDNNMPLMNGYETLQQIHANKSLHAIPVYLLSTSVTPSDHERFARLGIADCLVKPDSFNALCTLVDAIIQRYCKHA